MPHVAHGAPNAGGTPVSGGCSTAGGDRQSRPAAGTATSTNRRAVCFSNTESRESEHIAKRTAHLHRCWYGRSAKYSCLLVYEPGL